MDKIIFVRGDIDPDFSQINSELDKGWNVKAIVPQAVTSEYTYHGGFAVLLNDGKTSMIV
jgi:hypothetical protein